MNFATRPALVPIHPKRAPNYLSDFSAGTQSGHSARSAQSVPTMRALRTSIPSGLTTRSRGRAALERFTRAAAPERKTATIRAGIPMPDLGRAAMLHHPVTTLEPFSRPLNVGDRVLTPRGAGTIEGITLPPSTPWDRHPSTWVRVRLEEDAIAPDFLVKDCRPILRQDEVQ